MHKRLIPTATAVAALIAVGAPLAAADGAGAAATRSVGHHHKSRPASHGHGGRNGFPSAKQLGSLTNFVSTLTVSTLSTTQYVHSRDNYKQTVSGTHLTTILYHGKTYSELASMKQTRSVAKATAEDVPAYYGYANQLNNLFRSPVIVADRIGSCRVAGRAGQAWDIRSTGAGNKYASLDFHVCTAKRGGYLLSVEELSKISTSKELMSSAVKVTSIGRVPAYTPADL